MAPSSSLSLYGIVNSPCVAPRSDENVESWKEEESQMTNELTHNFFIYCLGGKAAEDKFRMVKG